MDHANCRGGLDPRTIDPYGLEFCIATDVLDNVQRCFYRIYRYENVKWQCCVNSTCFDARLVTGCLPVM